MTREELKNYKYNQKWIKDRLEYIEEYKASIENITSVLSDMPKGSKEVQDSMAEKIAILLDKWIARKNSKRTKKSKANIKSIR